MVHTYCWSSYKYNIGVLFTSSIRLEIRNVTDDDFGLYICTVSNLVSVPFDLRDSITQTANAELIMQSKLTQLDY